MIQIGTRRSERILLLVRNDVNSSAKAKAASKIREVSFDANEIFWPPLRNRDSPIWLPNDSAGKLLTYVAVIS